jgi:hypothetical protein
MALVKRLVIGLFFTLLMLVTIATLIGRVLYDPNPLQTLGFELCAGIPCYRGLTPGVTLWFPAKQFMTDHGAVDDPAKDFMDFSLADEHISAGTPFGAKYLMYIAVRNIRNAKASTTLKDAIVLFGVPCGVGSEYFPGTATVYYPTATLNVLPVDHSLTPDSPLIYLELMDAKQTKRKDINGNDSLCNGPGQAPWLGFTTLTRYRASGAVFLELD